MGRLASSNWKETVNFQGTPEQYGTAPPLNQDTSGNGPSGPRAGFWRRFGAALLDGILIGIVNAILIAALKTTGKPWRS